MSKSFKPTLAERLSSVGEYYFSKKLREIEELRRDGKQIISLGIGSPDMAPHPSVIARLNSESQRANVHGYQSYRGAAELRQAFAAWYWRKFGVELDAESEVLPLIGSKEGLMHICMTYLNRGDRFLKDTATTEIYTSAVRLAGGEEVGYALSEEMMWQPDLEHLPTEGVRMMIINYPHMPTGAVASLDMLGRIVDFCRQHDILLINDNPYCFIRNATPISIMQVDGAKEVAIELTSLSKSHNMAGWRVGAVIAAKERVDEILRFKSNMDSGMFLPVQAAAATALSLGDEWYVQQNVEYYRREEIGMAIFDALNITYSRNQAGLFLWGRLPQGRECYEFCDALLYEKGVFLTPGGIFGSAGEQYMRLSLCADCQTLRGVLEIVKG